MSASAFRGTLCLAVAVIALACAERGRRQYRYPPPQAPVGPAATAAPSGVASAAAPPTPAPTPTPTSVTLAEQKAITFHGGAPLKLVPIAKQTAIHALSPDARSWVIDAPGNTVKLVTPLLPAGVSHPVWVPSAIFSDDGSKVAIWSTSGLAVFEVATGRLLAQRGGDICAARFLGPNAVLFHESSKEPTARLWQWQLGAPAPAPLGSAREADTCRASPDGRSWIVESYDKRWYIDGPSGGARSLPGPQQPGTVSLAGNRVCVGDDRGLTCVRYPDERTERVWSRPTSDSVVFESNGTHAMITYAKGPDTVRDSFALVDFVALTVRPLVGVKARSGSLFSLSPGAKLLTMGSGSGLWVYDVERAQTRFAAHSPLYGNHVFPHHPRRVVAGTDEPMDLYLVEVN